ncbi:diguanylate cyclase (GGDEF) domain-containing protein [Methylobacterium sp. 174MFSha1.1]|uniref:GGDEF domain-containing protein n=1 Tax=Methylobacterium sp. 174MFSha1.1 TaxID=1502749 RepID=UPI0008E1B18A|nr:GGDEF domain-containing protein [Methylobacterium sp. 174MFSha1.1]SFU90760.1 diguanylate cyclase (GGDEF) domain-containing protein [Methylobacterium sp. 174MFSha1.1]
MPDAPPTYLLPRAAPLRWLVDPSLDLPAELRIRLLATLMASPSSLVIGAVAMLIIEAVAVIRHPGPVFPCLLAVDAGLLLLRLVLVARSRRAVAAGRPAPTDLLLASSLTWAGLVGIATVLCFMSGDPLLQVLAPLTMMGILAGIITRNYAAPRHALVMIVLCDLPLKLMLPFHYGDPWFLIGAVQGLLFVAAMRVTTVKLNRTYVEVLLAQRENQRRATHDALTGLRNRTGLMEDLADRLRRGDGLALLYLDLDGFKAVNDCLGHAAGDALLVEVAGRITAGIPGEWRAARLGGDEFVILAAGDRAHEAAITAARLIEAVKAPYAIGIGVGLSVGIGWAAPGMTPEALLAEADAALYRAKAAGKGRLMTAGAGAPGPRAAARVGWA